MKQSHKSVFKVVGIVLIVAALGTIGYGTYNIISAEVNTNNSLTEAEQVLSELDSLAPTDSGSTQDDGTAADDQWLDGALDGEDPALESPLPADSAAPDASGQTAPGGTGKKTNVSGILIFDTLGGRKVPVRNGTSDAILASGAARHTRSSLPGGPNCVIYGHRNTVFRGFGKLHIGDTIRYQVPGKTLTYKVQIMKVVEPLSTEIFQTHGAPAITLVTCYPFNYVGAAPQRYMVVATLVS